MKRKWFTIFIATILLEIVSAQHIELEAAVKQAVGMRITKHQGHVTKSNLRASRPHSAWSKWSVCKDGIRTRKKYCIRRQISEDSLRIEVSKCIGRRSTRHHLSRGKIEMRRRAKNNNQIETPHFRQLESDEIQKRFRGFSPWTSWSTCSRRCTTVRRRYCLRHLFCGRKVIRQSAYCYLEGSYCHVWIRGKMQRRKDPEYTIEKESMSPPVMAIHPEDSRLSRPIELDCGKIGKYRGSKAIRMRSRMRDMMRIIGGKPAPPGKWPWQVAILNRYKIQGQLRVSKMNKCYFVGYISPAHDIAVLEIERDENFISNMLPKSEAFCGGTLVALRWVVTAAHCVRKRLYVRLGEHDLLLRSPEEVEMRVTEAIVHPLYDPDTVVNDVALLRLPWSARPELGHGLACLPKVDQPLFPHTTCVILGWGKKRASDIHGTRILHEAQNARLIQPGLSKLLYVCNVEDRQTGADQPPQTAPVHEVNVSTIQQGVCRRSYWQYAITDNMVCAGRGRRDSCAGDSGGPLLCKDTNYRYYLQGITSFGDGCGKRGKYGIYTRTAGYVMWMREVMAKKYFD